jgi:hypothetical protein
MNVFQKKKKMKKNKKKKKARNYPTYCFITYCGLLELHVVHLHRA